MRELLNVHWAEFNIPIEFLIDELQSVSCPCPQENNQTNNVRVYFNLKRLIKSLFINLGSHFPTQPIPSIPSNRPSDERTDPKSDTNIPCNPVSGFPYTHLGCISVRYRILFGIRILGCTFKGGRAKGGGSTHIQIACWCPSHQTVSLNE